MEVFMQCICFNAVNQSIMELGDLSPLLNKFLERLVQKTKGVLGTIAVDVSIKGQVSAELEVVAGNFSSGSFVVSVATTEEAKYRILKGETNREETKERLLFVFGGDEFWVTSDPENVELSGDLQKMGVDKMGVDTAIDLMIEKIRTMVITRKDDLEKILKVLT